MRSAPFFVMSDDMKNAASNEDRLIAIGGSIKALGNGKVAGYLVRFTDEQHQDLDDDYFDSKTWLDAKVGDRGSFYYQHGMNLTIGGRKLGEGIIAKIDDVGIFIEGELQLRDEYEKAIYERLVKAGKAGWSSTAMPHLIERVPTGRMGHRGEVHYIKAWPLGKDWTITPTPAAGLDFTTVIPFKTWREANPNLQALEPEMSGDDMALSATASDSQPTEEHNERGKTMSELTPEAVDERIQAALKAEREAREAEAQAKADREAHDAKLIAEARKAWEAEQAPVNDSGFAAPYVAKHNDVWKYDNYPAEDLATVATIVGNARSSMKPEEVSRSEANRPGILKALALRLESGDADDTSKRTIAGGAEVELPGALKVARGYMKHAGIKADETNFSTNAGYGDEWIGVAYSGQLWDAVREYSNIARRLPSFEFPMGAESMVIPLESTDPVWYLVAQAGDPASATAQVTNTVPAKAVATAQVSMTLGKLGSSTIYTGEMVEDSMLPFAAQLRRQITQSGAEYLDAALIDGDNATATTTNVNDIAGTPAATDWFLIWDGFRVSPLVTTTANSRDGGTLASEDFLATVQLMGPGGKAGFNRSKVGFIVDPHTHWKAVQLADVKTKDVFTNATVEGGMLTSIWGYEVICSYQMHFASLVNTGYEYKTNTAGKIDVDTAANNTKGAILAVRWDHWNLGYKRRLTTEVERIPRADSWEITSILRAGLVQRDTEAAAISYNITV